MGARFLTLSLFILMLSFFIVLNSFSTFETTKARSLIKSVTETFSARETGDTIVPQFGGTGGGVSENPLDRLDSVLQNQTAAGTEAKSNRLRTAMKISLPVEKFETMIGENGELLPVLASVFEPESGPSYTMKMVLNISANPAEFSRHDPARAAAAIKKSAALMQTLQDTGLPEDFMSAGVGQGPEGTVDLIFQRDPSYKSGGT
ncbi:MAG: flagellar motor protein MotB [Alphaproteobacteria bacterium]